MLKNQELKKLHEVIRLHDPNLIGIEYLIARAARLDALESAKFQPDSFIADNPATTQPPQTAFSLESVSKLRSTASNLEHKSIKEIQDVVDKFDLDSYRTSIQEKLKDPEFVARINNFNLEKAFARYEDSTSLQYIFIVDSVPFLETCKNSMFITDLSAARVQE